MVDQKYFMMFIGHIMLTCVPMADEFNLTLVLSSFLKNKRGTKFTPMFQWPDKSVSLGVTQPLAWKRSGLMVRPSIQVR